MMVRPPKPVSDAIKDALDSTNPGTRLEGLAAQTLQEAGFEITAFDKEVYSDQKDRMLGHIDIETRNTIVEVTTERSGKLGQVRNRLRNPDLNPNGKPVVLYAPRYLAVAERDVVAAGAYLVRTPQELVDLILKLGADHV